MAKPEIVIVGAGGLGTTVGMHINSDKEVIIVGTPMEMQKQEQSLKSDHIYVIENLRNPPMPEVSIKEVNKHPFDKFINGKRKRR